jgi:hypothetical protein
MWSPGAHYTILVHQHQCRHYRNKDPDSSDERPYRITWKNLNLDDAVELKLSENGGYQWIERGGYVTHATDIQHDFEVRDNSGNIMLVVCLFDAEAEEL